MKNRIERVNPVKYLIYTNIGVTKSIIFTFLISQKYLRYLILTILYLR